MNCVNCGKPIRQATVEELESISVHNFSHKLEWYKHISPGKEHGLWSCNNGKGNSATATSGTKWIGPKPNYNNEYNHILMMKPKVLQEVKIKKPRTKRTKKLRVPPVPTGRKFRFD